MIVLERLFIKISHATRNTPRWDEGFKFEVLAAPIQPW
jgi:hypothetical protein